MVEFVDALGYVGIIILLLLGLVIAFFGKKIMETLAFIIGAIIGAGLAMSLAPRLHPYVEEYIPMDICIIIAVIIGALIGGFLGRAFMYGMISFFVASIFSGIAYSLSNENYIVTIIVFIVVLVIMWFVVEKFLAVITAFLGACMVGMAVMELTFESLNNNGLGFIALILFILIAALLTIAGGRYQLQNE